MFITIEGATETAIGALRALGYADADAGTIADHLIDCELRGLGFSGLARILSIGDRLAGDRPAGSRSIRVTRESPVSAQLDGGDALGYLVGLRAAELAVEKAEASGLAVVGASNTWYTGMLSYYAEIAAAAGMVSVIVSNATAWVAPFGGTQARFGTNPVCFGFPTGGTPVIWDIGISEIIHAQAVLAQRTGNPLPEGVAYDREGKPTVDPAAALDGAFVAWGGHKGSGLGISVQLLGALVGSPVLPGQLRDFGFFILVLKPDLFGDAEVFEEKARSYAESIRATRPADPDRPVRVPFERSEADRARRREAGGFELDEGVLDAVARMGGPAAR